MMDESKSFRSAPSTASQSRSPTQKAPKAYRRSPRFNYWLLFFLFSLIVAGSSIEASDRVQAFERGIRNQKWAVSCSVATFIVALGVVVMHISPGGSLLIIGTKLEGALILLMIGLWSALVAVISDTANGLAVEGDGGVSYGNLYYFGWAGFATAMVLLVSYVRTVHYMELSQELEMRADRLNLWAAMLTSSLVLMSSAANVYDYSCSEDENKQGRKFCNRNLLAMVMGGLGATFSIVVIGMKLSNGIAPYRLELGFSAFLFLAHCYTCPLVTSEQGPGAKIGNLYYFSWISMILPFLLVASCYEQHARNHGEYGSGDGSRIAPMTEYGDGNTTYYEHDGMTQYYGDDGVSQYHDGMTRAYDDDGITKCSSSRHSASHSLYPSK